MDQAIINTLCYSEIFSYPLTFSELWKYLIYPRPVSVKTLEKNLIKNRHILEFKNGYIVLRGDSHLITERIKRSSYSRKKYTKALFISHVLSIIPTVKLVGVSGSLSMNNAKKEDDIDLFIITSKNSLWITRFIVSTILLLLKEKRIRGDRLSQDKICANMFLSEDNLAIPKKLRNIYTAHEIVQVKVLCSKSNTQENFFIKNKWVLNFMPNAYKIGKASKIRKSIKQQIIIPFEFIFYKLQYLYMKKRITNEYVRQNIAMFHPIKTAEVVVALLALKIQARTVFKQKIQNKKDKYALLN